MPKILTVTPAEGETSESFAKRVAQESAAFFGDAEDATDVSADVADEVPSS